MRKLTTASRFAGSLALGLLWGAIAAAGALDAMIVGVIAASATFSFGLIPNALLTLGLVALITIVCAAALALFPIGPLAALLAWPLYRAGVTSAWAYAIAGAMAAAYVPLLLLAISFANSATDPPHPIVFAWFAMAGAVGGYVAGRWLPSGR